MQIFNVDAAMFFFMKFQLFFAHENMKKTPSKVAHNLPKHFFQYCQPAQNQPKSHILFHKNGSLGNFDYSTQRFLN